MILIKAGIGLWHSLSFDLFCIKNCCNRYFISHMSRCILGPFLGACLLHHSYWERDFICWSIINFSHTKLSLQEEFYLNTDKYQTAGKNNPFCFKNVQFQSRFSYEFAIIASFCLHRAIAAMQRRHSWAWGLALAMSQVCGVDSHNNSLHICGRDEYCSFLARSRAPVLWQGYARESLKGSRVPVLSA